MASVSDERRTTTSSGEMSNVPCVAVVKQGPALFVGYVRESTKRSPRPRRARIQHDQNTRRSSIRSTIVRPTWFQGPQVNGPPRNDSYHDEPRV